MDMSTTIAPKSDQLNADDLIGGPRTIRVTRVSGNDNVEQPVNIFFEGDNGKPFRPCKSMRRVMVHVWGADANQYVGRAMTIYRDPGVQFGGMQVGGIRISHMTGIDKPATMALTATRAKRTPFTVQPLQGEGPRVPADLIDRARAAAKKGTAAFGAFWNDPTVKPHREALRGDLAEFQRIAKEADAPPISDDNPFGLPPLDDDAIRAQIDAEHDAAMQDN